MTVDAIDERDGAGVVGYDIFVGHLIVVGTAVVVVII